MTRFKEILEIETGKGIAFIDLTDPIERALDRSGIEEGFLFLKSPHTTTALIVNENEPRLLSDLEVFLKRLVPPTGRYRHNDIHLRNCPPDEPENAHAHLCAILLGSSLSLPVEAGRPLLGKWQSIFLVELDGPRTRKLHLSLWGFGRAVWKRSI